MAGELCHYPRSQTHRHCRQCCLSQLEQALARFGVGAFGLAQHSSNRLPGVMSHSWLHALAAHPRQCPAYLVVYRFSQWLQSVAGYLADVTGIMQLPRRHPRRDGRGGRVAQQSRPHPADRRDGVPVAAGLLLALTGAGSLLWMLLIIIALFGVPQGLASVSSQATVYTQAPTGEMGAASGLSRSSVQIGAILASRIVGPIYGTRPSDAGLHHMAWIIVGLAAAALVLTVADRQLRTIGDRQLRAVNETSDAPAI